ncbi:TonB-dependent receptor plug domain-containing protein [Pontibacter sp. JAM-7]|uniref:TonB-dependent receptor plug domain-containing protein n=1 Tax=Pontibacter sp. JAM-7 TaxID=3366581 RepID=UPI003AF70640
MSRFLHLPLTLLSTAMVCAQPVYADSADQSFLVVASRVDTARFETGSSVSVLDQSELAARQVRTVAEALRTVPGVSVVQAGGPGGQTQVRIRGAEANHTLVLLDGIEVSATSGTDFDLAHILTLNVERIEILRGAQTALWGPDALGGVINIITRKGQGAPEYSVQMEAGRYDSHQETLTLQGGSDKGHYALAVSHQKTRGISVAPEALGNTERDGYRNQTLNLKAGLYLSERAELDLVLRHTKADVAYDFNPFDADATADVAQTFARVGGRWQSQDLHWQHKLDLSLADNDRDDYSAGVHSTVNRGRKEKLAYQGTYQWSEGQADQHLTLALEGENEAFINEYIHPMWGYRVDKTHQTRGAALEYGLNLEQDLYLIMDLRRDKSNLFDHETTWRLAVASWLGEQVRLHSSIGKGIKYPSLTELYGYSTDFIGNPDLKPERARTIDLGAEYHFAQLDGLIDLTLFRNRVEDLIVGAGISSLNTEQQATLKGVELALELKPSDRLRLNASYTYTATDDGTGADLQRRPRHSVSLGSSYLLSNGKTELTTTFHHQGKRYDTNFNVWPAERVTLGSYTLLDLALSHQYSPALSLYARLDNTFDQDYEEVFEYASEGRMLTLGFTWTGGL